jgi:hypothetical protein
MTPFDQADFDAHEPVHFFSGPAAPRQLPRVKHAN